MSQRVDQPLVDQPRVGQPLVDIHCHGAVGATFGGPLEGTRAAIAHHRATGAGRLVASLVSAPNDVLAEQVRALAPLVAAGELDGIHIEGPCLATAYRGAHDESALSFPNPALVEQLVAAAAQGGSERAIQHWTFAPELPGADHFVRALTQHRIMPAIGHTGADASTTERALGRVCELTEGDALVTHLFNGMPPLHHRGGGPVSAALAAAARGEAVVELIADGVHVNAEVVRMLFDLVGPDQIALVSDAMAATGLGDGAYTLGSLPVTVEKGVARVTTTGAIAGSTSTLADCVRWVTEVAGVALDDAHRAACHTPARVLGLSEGARFTGPDRA